MARLPVRRYDIGDSCVCWSLGTGIDVEVSGRVLRAYRAARDRLSGVPGIRDLVPSYHALAVHIDPMVADLDGLNDIIESLLAEEPPETAMDQAAEPRIFSVVYRGPDLHRVAASSKLTVRQVIDRHTAPVYTVAMIGFLPHFPYLIGLDPVLETPRLDSPRKSVPAGSVAIGGAQTGVYPSPSPGGWNLIGCTDPSGLIHLMPGDRVIFKEAR
ncbi:5-oxoprolinase subunit PxpB [Desulfatiferula olefinivorans]